MKDETLIDFYSMPQEERLKNIDLETASFIFDLVGNYDNIQDWAIAEAKELIINQIKSGVPHHLIEIGWSSDPTLPKPNNK